MEVWSFEKEIVFSEMVIILVGALGVLYIILKSDTLTVAAIQDVQK